MARRKGRRRRRRTLEIAAAVEQLLDRARLEAATATGADARRWWGYLAFELERCLWE